MTFRRIGFNSTLGILSCATVLGAIQTLAVLFYMFSNIKPVIRFSNGALLYFADLNKGIPLPVSYNFNLPDSMDREMQIIAKPDSSGHFSTTKKAFTSYKLFNSSDKNLSATHPASVREVVLDSGKVYFEPKTITARIVLCFPLLFYLLAATSGIWQINRLLNDVLHNKAFYPLNSRRLRNVGWIIISNQAVLLFYYLVSGYWWINAKYSGARDDGGNPLQFSFKLNYDFSFTWLIVGIMILIIAAAFRNGSLLQEEQDLTV